MIIHYVIHSYGLIPDVEMFDSKKDAEEYWIEAFGDLKQDYDEKTPKESFERGFAHWHDVEMRYNEYQLINTTEALQKLIESLKEGDDDDWLEGIADKLTDPYTVQIILNMVQETPNDQKLGKSVRGFFKGVEEWRV
tara:strand:+ start:985 stop:1395 length:411 start_codon:yes stop_codon:yes gene_type:complete